MRAAPAGVCLTLMSSRALADVPVSCGRADGPLPADLSQSILSLSFSALDSANPQMSSCVGFLAYSAAVIAGLRSIFVSPSAMRATASRMSFSVVKRPMQKRTDEAASS